MEQSVQPLKVYLNTKQEGVVTCPHCGFGKTINLSNYPDYLGGRSLNIRCKRCDAAFPVKFDHRQHSRVEVGFPGKLLHCTDINIEKNIIVTSLSVTGVGFIMPDVLKINVDDVLDIQFHLDDNDRSVIQEKVTVRRISGTFVGAEYCEDAYRHELDFYVIRTSTYV